MSKIVKILKMSKIVKILKMSKMYRSIAHEMPNLVVNVVLLLHLHIFLTVLLLCGIVNSNKN